MSIKLKQINSEYVKPVKYTDGKVVDSRPIKGASLFEEIYSNIIIFAKKKSGKTTTLNKIVRDCATTDTTVMVFASTLDKDRNHISIKQYCKSHRIPYIGYTSMKDDDIDIIDVLLQKLKAEAAEEEQSDSEEDEIVIPKKEQIVLFESDEDSEDEPKRRKNKFQAPQYLIILDDLSNELKSKVLTTLTKQNRHYKCKIIISTQYCCDVLPETIKQCDYALIFKGESKEKLQKIHGNLDLALDFDVFEEIYHNATKEKFSFLYISARTEEYRRNFTHKYTIDL